MTVRMFERCLVACANYPGGLQLPSFCLAGACAWCCGSCQLSLLRAASHLHVFQTCVQLMCILQPRVHALGSRQHAVHPTATTCFAGATQTACRPGLRGRSPQRTSHLKLPAWLPADFWARFVRYQEGIDNVAAKLVLERATALFCKQRPEMHMFAGQFHERHGDVLAARASFELVTDSLAPTLLEGESC